jgi:hypothetical protein
MSTWSHCSILKNVLYDIEKNDPAIWSNPEIKKAVLKSILKDIKNNYIDAVVRMIATVRNKNIHWPELDIIEKNLPNKNKLSENLPELKIVEVYYDPGLDTSSEEDQLVLVNDNWANITYIRRPSIEVQKAAVSQSAMAMEYIIENGIKPTEEVQLLAVSNFPIAIKYILDGNIVPSETVQLAAVKSNAVILKHITNKIIPSLRVQLTALKEEPWMIRVLGNRLNPDIFTDVEYKRLLLKEIIYSIKNKEQNLAKELLDILEKHQIVWPELSVIRQIMPKYKIDESADINLASEHQQLKKVKIDPSIIREIENPSEAVQLAAITLGPHWTIDYLYINKIDPSEEVKLAAVQKNGHALEYIKYPSESVQLAAVEQNVFSVGHIQKSQISRKVKVYVLKMLMSFIKHKEFSDAIDLYKNLRSQRVNWQELEPIAQHLKKHRYVSESETTEFSNLSADEKIEQIKKHGFLIKNITNPSEDLQLLAVKNDGYWAIHWIIKNGIVPSEAVQLAAVKQNGSAIERILFHNIMPSQEVQKESIKTHADSIRFIVDKFDPSIDVKLTALQRDPRSLKYFDSSDLIWKNPAIKRHMLETILFNFKLNYTNYAMAMLKSLKQLTDWPELTVIENNIRKKLELS